MYDSYNRHIHYLRISVTDRCNLRCSYCFVDENPSFVKEDDLLSVDEIELLAKEAVALGINKIRLTGGEPLLRSDIVDIVRRLAQVDGLTDLALTTNGQLLAALAPALKEAGLKRVNVSLDTLDPDRFREITHGDVMRTIEGLMVARHVGLTPIKINSVKANYITAQEQSDLLAFCRKHDFDLRFIPQMDLEKGTFSIVEGGEGGNCQKCNRLRVSCSGEIFPCLFSQETISIRQMGIRQALMTACRLKPERGGSSQQGRFFNIGG